jgi:hypothetical protein
LACERVEVVVGAAVEFSRVISLQHDLADVLAGFHPRVRGRGFGEREHAVHRRAQLALLDQRPHGARDLVGEQCLELVRAAAQRRAGDRVRRTITPAMLIVACAPPSTAIVTSRPSSPRQSRLRWV